MFGEKKGLSDVITTVLIIVLALAAVAIIGGVVLSQVNKGAEKVSAEQLCNSAALKISSCVYQNNAGAITASVVSSRDGGENVPLSNVSIVLTTASGGIQTFFHYSSSNLPVALSSTPLSLAVSGNSNPSSVRMAYGVKLPSGKSYSCRDLTPEVKCSVFVPTPGNPTIPSSSLGIKSPTYSTVSGTSPSPSCNMNGHCDSGNGEDSNSCPEDCSSSCVPDGHCGSGEDINSCPVDCPSVCGDGLCNLGEDFNSCSQDCPTGNCVPDGHCDPGNGEDSNSCPADCP